jgi:hypothetical protein
MNITNAETFESNIEESLISSGGYVKRSSANYQIEVGCELGLTAGSKIPACEIETSQWVP